MVWTAISNKLNKYGPPKTKTQWVQCWRDMRASVLKKQQYILPPKFSADEQRILKLVNTIDEGAVTESENENELQSEESGGENFEPTHTSILKSILDAPSTSEAKARLQQITTPITKKHSVPSSKFAKVPKINSPGLHQYHATPPTNPTPPPVTEFTPAVPINISDAALYAAAAFPAAIQDNVIIQLNKLQDISYKQLKVQTEILAELKKINDRQDSQLQIMSRLEHIAIMTIPVSQGNGESTDNNIEL